MKPGSKPVTGEMLEMLQGGHILLVEDNEINQKVAMEILKNMGLHVLIANNGDEALVMAWGFLCGLVCLDNEKAWSAGYPTIRAWLFLWLPGLQAARAASSLGYRCPGHPASSRSRDRRRPAGSG